MHMAAVCFYFQVHQPWRVKRYRVFDIGTDSNYFNEAGETNYNNERILRKVASKSYLPANAVMLDLLRKHPEFRVSYSFSGVFLEQLEKFSPETLDSFKRLVDTGRVEVLSETYYHSLASLFSPKEFREQVRLHREKVKNLFGYAPTVFRNTELIYSNAIAKEAEAMGYAGILAEGADHILEWRSPNFLYTPKGASKISLLLKNYKLSDDIAFRFSSRDWAEFPLTAPKFAQWVNAVNGSGDVVNLFMDYETFGEHQWEDTGIFNFLRALPEEILRHPDNSFVTPSEAIERYVAVSELDIHTTISWADIERDLSAWLSNDMQHEASKRVYALEAAALATRDPDIIRDWRRLQTSDHFYYMCTKWWSDGDVHKYFSPYASPYEAFIYFMNTLHDLELRISCYTIEKRESPKKSERLSR